MAEILIDVDLRHPADRVWRALTEQVALAAWFMPTDLAPHEGRHYTLDPQDLAGFDGPIDAELVEVSAPRRMVMLWQDEETRCRVTWDLVPTDEGTRLSMAQTGFFGVQGTLRRRKLQRTYELMLNTRLPAVLDRLAAGLALPAGERSGSPTSDDAELEPAEDVLGLFATPVSFTDWDDPVAAGPEQTAEQPEVAHDRRRTALVGAVVGGTTVLLAVILGGWFVVPRVLPALGIGQAKGADSAGVGSGGEAGGGGLGPASTIPTTTASPTPTTAPTTTSSPGATTGATANPSGEPAPTAAPTRTTRPGGPKPTERPGGGPRPAGEWFAGYHVVKMSNAATALEMVVGNIGNAPASGWQVVITLPEGLRLGVVRGANVSAADNQATFTALDPGEELPPQGSVRFRFRLLGADAMPTSCFVNGKPCAAASE